MKQFKATILKRYTIKGTLTTYYYYDLKGNFVKNTNSFYKDLQDPQTEINLVKRFDVINICYNINYCNGKTINFIETLAEAIILKRKWINLSQLKPGKRYTEINGIYTEIKPLQK